MLMQLIEKFPEFSICDSHMTEQCHEQPNTQINVDIATGNWKS